MILIPLEQLYTSHESIRKAREAFLIHRGKTLEPAGINRIDIAFIVSSSTCAWLLSPLECSPQKQNG